MASRTASRTLLSLRTSPPRRTSSPDVRAALHSAARPQRPRLTNRAFSTTTGLRRPEDHNKDIPPEKAGSYSRTSPDVTVQYPPDHLLRPTRPVSMAPDGSKPTLSSFSLEGRVGVVTGGARGLGLVMGQGMVYSGMDLAIVDLNKEEAEKQAKELTKAFEKFSPQAKRIPRVTAHYCDVGDEASVQSCIDEVVGVHGKIDGLVTSAGFTENFDAVNYPIDRMRKLWQVNVDGTYLWATGVARHLMARKAPGSIVLIGSMSGTIVNVPQPQAPYNAAKAAVRHLAASLAVEWAGHGIRCNAIMPGYFLSALTQKILDDNPILRDKWISLIPVGKMGVPEQLMGPAVFLLSDASSYMTGSEIRVDGAYTCS